jgi:hypothetical protein
LGQGAADRACQLAQRTSELDRAAAAAATRGDGSALSSRSWQCSQLPVTPLLTMHIIALLSFYRSFDINFNTRYRLRVWNLTNSF